MKIKAALLVLVATLLGAGCVIAPEPYATYGPYDDYSPPQVYLADTPVYYAAHPSAPVLWCAGTEFAAQGCGYGAGCTGQASRGADRASRHGRGRAWGGAAGPPMQESLLTEDFSKGSNFFTRHLQSGQSESALKGIGLDGLERIRRFLQPGGATPCCLLY